MFYLEGLSIEGFRNYQHQKLQFHPRLNLLIGENAQGKTNLLESIFYLSVTRSFRTHRDQELVHWGNALFFLKGIFVKEDFKNTVRVHYPQNGKLKVSINDAVVNRFEHMQRYPVIVFSPDDLMIIKEGPAVRRRFINLEASRLSNAYLQDLKNYQRVLMQRNNILKEKKSRSQINDLLSPWDHALIKYGVSLIKYRLEIIEALEKEAQFFFDKITSSKEILTMQYESTVSYNKDNKEMENSFFHDLRGKRDQEIKRSSTIMGPHLDDIKIYINGYDSRYYSSQGQKRTAALALKMSEISLFKNQNDFCPILLLDDVFSEFDEIRKQHLLDFLRENNGQCFITTAVDQSCLLKNLKRDYKVISVCQGNVKDETIRTSS